MANIELGEAFVEKARKYGVTTKEVTEMFDRAEALQNTAKAIKGLKALDDDALEALYREAKAERRERSKSAKPIDYPHIRIEGTEGFGDWSWTEYVYDGYVAGSVSGFDSKEDAEKAVRAFLAEDNLDLPIFYV